MNVSRIARWLALGAGAMDLLTGLGLVARPVFTLSAMRVSAPSGDALVFVRFVGAFVGAVGAMYLWAALGSRDRLMTVLGATILPRLAAGTFCAVGVFSNALEPAWVTVAVTDLTLVALQAWLFWRHKYD